ncbi:MAG: hypothetical protein LBE34_12865 [Flavobacteriaceae bacterium]|jgi:hypothetical protein|nr:hypothetical protein [Flavobacteriaceae bacterium]
MIEVLKLVQIYQVMPGGSTMPLLIEAKNSKGEIGKYVVKLFSVKMNKENFSLAKEIIVNCMAKEFDLNVPSFGVIKIDFSLLKDYYPENVIEKLDKGFAFCSSFMSQHVLADSNFSVKFAGNYNFPILYAFDSLILNTDRGGFRNKPNLLVNDDEFCLIDHELTLPFINSLYTTKDKGNYFISLSNFAYQKHIAFDILRKRSNDKHMFDEFEEYMKFFDSTRINAIFNELNFLGIPYGAKASYNDFFNLFKSKSNDVCKIIKESLR